MNERNFGVLILGIILICGGCGGTERSEILTNIRAATPVETLSIPESTKECGHLALRYAVTQDGPLSDKIWNVQIFLDPKQFSEANLRDLFGHFSKKYPQPDTLMIYVETDWERISPPDACPSGMSSLPKDPKENDFHKAVFRRHGTSATFRFNPILKTTDRKTVKLEQGTF